MIGSLQVSAQIAVRGIGHQILGQIHHLSLHLVTLIAYLALWSGLIVLLQVGDMHCTMFQAPPLNYDAFKISIRLFA